MGDDQIRVKACTFIPSAKTTLSVDFEQGLAQALKKGSSDKKERQERQEYAKSLTTTRREVQKLLETPLFTDGADKLQDSVNSYSVLLLGLINEFPKQEAKPAQETPAQVSEAGKPAGPRFKAANTCDHSDVI